MTRRLEKKDWILLALSVAPLDRLRLMKALFLTWQDVGRSIPDYFEFQPYMYGPVSFELYSCLEDLQAAGMIVQPPSPFPRSARYYLTDTGQDVAREAQQEAPSSQFDALQRNVSFAARAGFAELLARTYEAAPDFAVNSVVSTVVRQSR